MELVLSPAGVRFAVSPLEEVVGVVRVWLGRRRLPGTVPWLAEAPKPDVPELTAVLGARHYLTEFLSPPPESVHTTAQEQLDRVRATPPEQVALELGMVDADLGALPDDPARARDALADQLETVWHEVVEPRWPQLHEIIASDLAHRTRVLGEHGVRRLFETLHPRVRIAENNAENNAENIAENIVLVDLAARDRLRLDRRGLLLVPGVFAWPSVGVVAVPPWQPTLLYPARGVAALWTEPARPAEALAGVVGRTKAILLTALEDPAATTELAGRLGLAKATVSAHLTALRAAGLVTATRRGHRVLYRRTELGDALQAGIG